MWKECGEEGHDATPRKTPHPPDASCETLPAVSRDNEGGGTETGGRGRATTTTMPAGRHHRPRDPEGNNITNDQGDGGRTARRDGRLTSPSTGDGDGVPLPGVSDQDTATTMEQQPKDHQRKHRQAGVTKSVMFRSPSPATSLATTADVARGEAGVAATAGGLWGGEASGCGGRGGGGGGGDVESRTSVGYKARDKNKGRRGLRTWGKRRQRSHTELAEWIESNTNLMNLAPW